MIIIFRDICIRIPATHWLYNYLFVFTKMHGRGSFQLSIKKPSYKLDWAPYAINMWKQPSKFTHLLGGSDVYCFNKNKSGHQASKTAICCDICSCEKSCEKQ